MTTQERIAKYAELVVSSSLPIRKGTKLEIRVEPESYAFAAEVAKAAYKKGAAYVEIGMLDKYLLAERIENNDDSELEFIPMYQSSKEYEIIADEWCRLYIEETEQQDALDGANKDKLKKLKQAAARGKRRLMEAVLASVMPWAIVAFPGPKWAKQVTGIEDEKEAVDELWKILDPILRFDQPDPVKAWEEHSDMLVARAQKLTDLGLRTLRFTGGGSDFEVGLRPEAQWVGGPDRSRSDLKFMPNIPTEEIFTTPDFSKTTGHAKITRPVMVYNTLVEGLELDFENGKLVNFTAEKNQDIFESFVNTDEGARFLGEVALVDISSPIAQSGKFFNSILFDENAVSHIALGAGYPKGLKDSDNLTSQELKDLGCNDSMVHIDFMVGHPESKVLGYDAQGKEHVIMENGTFKI